MKRNLTLALTLMIMIAAGALSAPAQFPIKIPKIKKPTVTPPTITATTPEIGDTQTTGDNKSDSRSSDESKNPIANTAIGDTPTVAKDSVVVNAFTLSSYKGDFKVWSWVPKMEFRVNGPIESGGQLYAEFALPTGAWVKFDCQTSETLKGRWLKTECGGRDGIPEEKGMTFSGPVSFKIKIRNELGGTDSTLYTGKVKVLKARSNETGPDYVNHFVYYVDQDWNLPIGYISFDADDVSGWKFPGFNVAFWVRGEASRFEPHLFYQGKEVGKIFYGSDVVGTPGCGRVDEVNPTNYVAENIPQRAKWARVECSFPNIKAWDKTGETRDNFPGQTGKIHMLANNPGEYEFKLLWNNHLARSIKFTVGPDGRIVDNGVASGNRLGSSRLIFPAQIIGDQDGPWDKAAWRTDAYYGNPLTGFTAVP
ncbi:MAG TPA: hypothetical protein VLI65_08230 [Pyrinomonadaceae bacterium]|nr:hypothetical protein [Pyrinomonadaceae bacterium]